MWARILVNIINGKNRNEMENEIFKKAKDSIQNLKKLENSPEFKIWDLTNIGMKNKNLICYLEPP